METFSFYLQSKIILVGIFEKTGKASAIAVFLFAVQKNPRPLGCHPRAVSAKLRASGGIRLKQGFPCFGFESRHSDQKDRRGIGLACLFLLNGGIRRPEMQQSGGLLLQPVQTLVVTLINESSTTNSKTQQRYLSAGYIAFQIITE